MNKWKGTPYTGFEGNWPCPDDPENIMACIVKPCLGQVVGGQTQCLWREGCSEVLDLGEILFPHFFFFMSLNISFLCLFVCLWSFLCSVLFCSGVDGGFFQSSNCRCLY